MIKLNFKPTSVLSLISATFPYSSIVSIFQVFDVVLNGEHSVIPALDIYGRVGRGVAYDEYVPFTIMGNTVVSAGQESAIKGGKVRVEFVKVSVLLFFFFFFFFPQVHQFSTVNSSIASKKCRLG